MWNKRSIQKNLYFIIIIIMTVKIDWDCIRTNGWEFERVYEVKWERERERERDEIFSPRKMRKFWNVMYSTWYVMDNTWYVMYRTEHGYTIIYESTLIFYNLLVRYKRLFTNFWKGKLSQVFCDILYEDATIFII